MITERDRIAAMVARLNGFELERTEAVLIRLLREIAEILAWRAFEASLVRATDTTPCGCGTGEDYRFDPACPHHSGLRAAALARLGTRA